MEDNLSNLKIKYVFLIHMLAKSGDRGKTDLSLTLSLFFAGSSRMLNFGKEFSLRRTKEKNYGDQ